MFLPRRPSAVAGLVVLGSVYSVKREIVRRCPHVGQERFKTMPPSTANPYSAASIVGIGRMFWVVAPLKHRSPFSVCARLHGERLLVTYPKSNTIRTITVVVNQNERNQLIHNAVPQCLCKKRRQPLPIVCDSLATQLFRRLDGGCVRWINRSKVLAQGVHLRSW